MKKIYRYISIIALSASAVSCSFLEERQPTGLIETYSTKEMLESSCAGLNGGYYGTYALLGEAHEFFNYGSGLWHFTPTTGSKVKNYKYLAPMRFGMYTDVVQNGGLYTQYFSGINYCNVLISHLPESPVEQAYKDQIEAEAKFLRAVYYLDAVRLWGDLPLRTEPANAQNAPGIPRAPYYKIYVQIVKDLEDAEAGMRTPAQVRECTPTGVRPNKFAATAYLARTYLVIGSLLNHPHDNFWDEAKEGRKPDFSEIGLSGTYEECAKQAYTKALEYAEKLLPESATHDPLCEYALVPNYGDLFDYGFTPACTGYKNSEQILVLPISERSQTCYIAQRINPPHPEGSACWDASKGSTNNGRYRPSRFFFHRWCEDNGPVYRDGDYVSGKEADMLDCEDPRMEHSLWYNSVTDQATGKTTDIYPTVTKCSNGSDITVFPYVKKYNSRTYNINNGDANFYLMRFAEVYYIAAEAAAFVSGDPNNLKTKGYIEIVHSRARKSVPAGRPEAAYPSWKEKTFASFAELETAIFWDRMYEFISEGCEWYESHRHGSTWISETLGKPLNVFLDMPENSQLKKTTYAYPANYRYETDPQILRKALLAALPNDAIMYSTAITFDDQNDFYYQ